MAILDIIETPDARLRTISRRVAAVTDAHRALIADMFETMYDAPGIGLAAIQVGVAERILVIDLLRPATIVQYFVARRSKRTVIASSPRN